MKRRFLYLLNSFIWPCIVICLFILLILMLCLTVFWLIIWVITGQDVLSLLSEQFINDDKPIGKFINRVRQNSAWNKLEDPFL